MRGRYSLTPLVIGVQSRIIMHLGGPDLDTSETIKSNAHNKKRKTTTIFLSKPSLSRGSLDCESVAPLSQDLALFLFVL